MIYRDHDDYWKKAKAKPPPLIRWEHYESSKYAHHMLGFGVSSGYVVDAIGRSADAYNSQGKIVAMFIDPEINRLKALCQKHEDLNNLRT